ncbi:MAG: HD domain-containing protein, partial [Candidatus Zixiibacteriota bacterium]
MFVFPGATHTRFEHSLGVYYLAARYLEKLIDYSDFRQHCDDIDSSIRLIILSSLLHDIGHYPYSHWIEEIDIFPDGISFPSHESRASGIISSYNIKKIIKSDWGIDYEDISDIIAGDDKNDRFKLFISILNSLIGVDRIDYFMRDSVHCGVRYGEGIDLERLLDALMYVKGKNEICVSEKGRSSLLSILACRNIMYQEIYWHKTVRACDAMFKRFFYEYVKRGLARTEAIEKYFDYTDEKFISKLYNRVDNDKKGRDMIPLIRPFSLGEGERLLYKPGYVYYKSNAANEDRATRRYFKIVLSSNYEKLVSLGNELAKSLKNYLSGINEMDIILEKTPVDKDEKTSPRELKIVYNTRKKD